MSSANLKIANNKSNIVGHTYDARQISVVKPNLSENQYTKFFSPVTGTCGSTHTVEVNFSPNDLFVINDAVLEFGLSNKDTLVDVSVFNPWLLFSEMRLLLNGQEICFYDDMEKLFCAQSFYYKQFGKEKLLSKLQEIRVNPMVANFAGETIVKQTTSKFTLPLITVLFPFIRHMSRSHGLMKLTLEFRWQPNTATASSIGRFMQCSDGTKNPYTINIVEFQQITLRLLTTRHSEGAFYSVPKPLMVIPKFDDRMYATKWNAVGDSLRIQLTNDFTFRPMCHGILVYLYQQDAVTTFADAEAVKLHSRNKLIGWELKYKSRSVLKFDQATDVGAKATYYHRSNIKRFGTPLNTDLIADDGTALSLATTMVPVTFVDLQNLESSDAENEKVYSGISNGGGELELILTNTEGVFSVSPYVYVVLCYYEGALLDGKNGVITYKRDLFQ